MAGCGRRRLLAPVWPSLPRDFRHLVLVLLLLLCVALAAAASASAASCPGTATVGTAPDGTLLVCPGEGSSVHVGGGLSAAVAAAHTTSTRLDALIWNPLSNPQAIPTHAASYFAAFEIDGAHYLATTNLYNGTTYRIRSYIYKYDSKLGTFDIANPFQAPLMDGATDVEHFELGGEHFLAYACMLTDTGFDATNFIFKFDRASNKFDFNNPWQTFPSKGANHIRHVILGGKHHLALTRVSSPNVIASLSIFRFNETSGRFDTAAPWESRIEPYIHSLEIFSIGGEVFLLAIYLRDPSTNSLQSGSLLFKYDAQADSFHLNQPIQRIPTLVPASARHFEINGVHHLALSSFQSDAETFASQSPIFEFDPDTGLFILDEPVQFIDVSAGRHFEHFTVNGDHFLAVANMRSSIDDFSTESFIYKFDFTTNKFDTSAPFAALTTLGAHSWSSFVIGDTHFLALSCARTNSSFSTDSFLFRSSLKATLFQAPGTQTALTALHKQLDTQAHVLDDVATQAAAQQTGLASLEALMWNPIGSPQLIPTDGAFDFEYFQIQDAHFLAVASFEPANATIAYVYIYKFDPSTGRFDTAQPFQRLATFPTTDLEAFDIDGKHFLAVACVRSATGVLEAPSPIFVFDEVLGQFDPIPQQTITTFGAFAWKHFQIDGEHFLAVANLGQSTSGVFISYVYKKLPDGGSKLLFDSKSPFFEIEISFAQDVEFFSIGTAHFLAFASRQNSTTGDERGSRIFVFDNVTQSFDANNPLQVLPSGIRDLEFFVIDDESFLALAIDHPDATDPASFTSLILKFDENVGQFDLHAPFQQIVTPSIRDWEHFQVGENHYLAAARMQNGESLSALSLILKYDQPTRAFNTLQPFQSVPTQGASACHAFSIGSSFFLAIANRNSDDRGFFIDSFLFQTALPSAAQPSSETPFVFNVTLMQELQDALSATQARERALATKTSELEAEIARIKARLWNPLESVEIIPVDGASGLEYFEIGNEAFAAVASFKVNDSYSVPSSIFQLDVAAGKLVQPPVQTFVAPGSRGSKHFVIDGIHHLVFSSSYHGEKMVVDVSILRFNDESRQFTVHQNITLSSVFDVEYFQIGTEHFLGFAEFLYGKDYRYHSSIFKYDPDTDEFVSSHNISSIGAVDLEHFVIDGTHFLGVSHFKDDVNYTLLSNLYEWNPISRDFDLFQTFPTIGGSSMTHFKMAGEHFLAVANFRGSELKPLDSIIYKFDRGKNEFVPWQTIRTEGCRKFDYFEMGGISYLTMVSRANEEGVATTSYIYRYNTRFGRFDTIKPWQAVDGQTTMALKPFSAGDFFFLAFINVWDDRNLPADSFLFSTEALRS
eukprot:m.92159 g.92159  ORF g.92159 m.92159 type:complete len:1341 (-) comp8638_c0_seq1:137-4159(-)